MVTVVKFSNPYNIFLKCEIDIEKRIINGYSYKQYSLLMVSARESSSKFNNGLFYL